MAYRLPVLLCLLALSGCFGDERSPSIKGGTLTVYASLPLHGLSAGVARAVGAGQREALADAHGRAGRWRVRLVQLSCTAPGEQLWNPNRVSANADVAAQDPKTIAYLGELDYGASAVSLPITNDAGLLQVSPGDGLTSLTRRPPGRPRAGPERYYPSGRRTFQRLVPSDLLQARALLRRARGRDARRAAFVFDDRIYGTELAGELETVARREGPLPVRSEEFRHDPDAVPGLIRSLAKGRPDAVVYAGVAGPGVGPLLAGLSRRLPRVPVYATAGILAGHVRLAPAPGRVEALTPVRPLARLPREGRHVVRAASRRGAPARPEAAYGYESMRLVLDAIRRAGASRPGVVRAALAPRRRVSALGAYRVTGAGETGPASFVLYRLSRGRFELGGTVR